MGPGTWAGIARRIRRQWPWPLALEPGSASWQRTGIPKCPCGTEVVPTLCLVQPPALMRCGTNPLDQPRKLPACRSDLPACKEIPPRGRVVPGKVRGASRCRCCAPRPKGRPERTARTATRSRAYRPHCHSALSVPMRYARCHLAVRNALPLAPERAAQHVHHRVAVRTAPLRDLRQEDRPLRNLPALFPTPDERSLHRTRGFDHPVQPVGDGGRRERAQRLALS